MRRKRIIEQKMPISNEKQGKRRKNRATSFLFFALFFFFPFLPLEAFLSSSQAQTGLSTALSPTFQHMRYER